MKKSPSWKAFAVTVAASLCAATVLSGCGGGGSSTPANRSIEQNNEGALATGRYQDLVFTASAPKTVYSRGETIPFTFSIENQGSVDHQSLVSFFNRTVDAIVYGEDGENLGTIVFAPNTAGGPVDVPLVYEAGKTRSFSVEWQQRVIVPNKAELVPPGKYKLRFFIGVDNLDGNPTPERALSAGDLEITIK